MPFKPSCFLFYESLLGIIPEHSMSELSANGANAYPAGLARMLSPRTGNRKQSMSRNCLNKSVHNSLYPQLAEELPPYAEKEMGNKVLTISGLGK